MKKYNYKDFIDNYKLSKIPLSVKVKLRGYCHNYSYDTICTYSAYIGENEKVTLSNTYIKSYNNYYNKLTKYRWKANVYKDENYIYKLKPLSESINSDYKNFFNKVRAYYTDIKRR